MAPPPSRESQRGRPAQKPRNSSGEAPHKILGQSREDARHIQSPESEPGLPRAKAALQPGLSANTTLPRRGPGQARKHPALASGQPGSDLKARSGTLVSAARLAGGLGKVGGRH